MTKKIFKYDESKVENGINKAMKEINSRMKKKIPEYNPFRLLQPTPELSKSIKRNHQLNKNVISMLNEIQEKL